MSQERVSGIKARKGYKVKRIKEGGGGGDDIKRGKHRLKKSTVNILFRFCP